MHEREDDNYDAFVQDEDVSSDENAQSSNDSGNSSDSSWSPFLWKLSAVAFSTGMQWLWNMGKFVVKELAIEVGTSLVASAIVCMLKDANSSLTTRQCSLLQKMLGRCVRDYRQGRDISHLIRGILNLACPGHAASLTDSVLRTMERDADDNGFSGHYSYSSEADSTSQQEPPCADTNVHADFTSVHALDENAQRLIRQYGVSRDRALRIPVELRAPVIQVLQSNPTCCISMDNILDETTGKINPGTVVLFENVGGNPHAYMFTKEMIDEWFSSSGSNTNPLTRDDIDLNKQYFQLS